MNRQRTITIFGGAALLLGGVAAGRPMLADASPQPTDGADTSATASAETETTTVTRGDLVDKVEVNGTVGYGKPIALPVTAEGLVTDRPEPGSVLRSGDELVRVANKPIVLAEGEVPLYRELRSVLASERDEAGARLGRQKGADVEQLQRFLVAEGFDDKGRLSVDGNFGVTTERAVKDWQRSIGHPATGKVDRSQMVFIPGPIRVAEVAGVGQPFAQISVTTEAPKVTFTATARQRAFFQTGAEVTVEFGGSTATGRVIANERTVSDDGVAAYRVEIEFDEGQELPDGEAVKVISSTTTAADVLIVPVRALVALAEGGWAVQVATPQGPELTAVELGDVVDGNAEISGVDEGDEVVVPL